MEAGELTEEFFNTHQIEDDASEREKKRKDERSVSKRRSVILTNKTFQQRLKDQAEKTRKEKESHKKAKEQAEIRKVEKEKKKKEEEEYNTNRKKAMKEGPLKP